MAGGVQTGILPRIAPHFMLWIAPSEKDTDNAALEKRLWDAADQFRANSGLKSQETDETGRLCRMNLAA